MYPRMTDKRVLSGMKAQSDIQELYISELSKRKLKKENKKEKQD